MENLLANLKKTKSKNDLKAILSFIKENSINDHIKQSKDLIMFILDNIIDKDAQIEILLYFIDLFFSLSLKAEQLNLIPIERIFNSKHDFYSEIQFENLIASFYDLNYPKDKNLLLNLGDKIDFLQIDEGKYYLWTQGEIMSVKNEAKEYVVKLPFFNSNISIDFYSYRIQPFKTFTQDDFDWRFELSEGDIIDGLDSNDWWNKVTVFMKENDKIEVVLKTQDEDDKIPVGYGEYQGITSIYDSHLRKKGTYSFDIHYSNPYSSTPNSKFNSQSMHIPFNNKNYIIPKKIENKLSYSMQFISISTIFINKLLDNLKKENNVLMSLDYFEHFFVVCQIMFRIHEQIHPHFAMKFIPEFISKAAGYLMLFSKSETRNFTKASIELLVHNLKIIMQMAYYPCEINRHFIQFELLFGLNCFQSSIILEKQLLGLKIMGDTLKEVTKLKSFNDNSETITSLLHKGSNGTNLFDLFFNSNSHNEIIAKSSDIILPLFKLKLITRDHIDQLYEFIQTTTIKEIRKTIYVILSQIADDLPFELISYTMDKLFALQKEEITIEDTNLLMEFTKVIPTGHINKTVSKVLDLLFDLILKSGFNELIPSFCDMICYPDKFDDLIQFYLAFTERLMKSLCLNDLYIQMMFLSKLVQSIPKVLENKILPKMSSQIFLSSKTLSGLIVDFCKDKDNANFINILTYVLNILEATNNRNFVTNDFIKSLFERLSGENSPNKKFFFDWLKDLQDKKMLGNELIEFLFSLLKCYSTNKDGSSVNKEMLGFFWNLFVSINSINSKNYKVNTMNPFQMQYSDIIWFYLINSIKEETMIDNFIDMFALPWKTQEERSKIWNEVISKTFDSINDNNKSNCIRILGNLIEVSDSYGTASCKPHSSLMDSNEMTIKVINETDKKGDQRFEMKISSSLTLYDLKVLLSEKIKRPLLSFATFRFYTCELPSKYNGRTMGSLFINNGLLIIKNYDNFLIEKKSLVLDDMTEFTPEAKAVFQKIFNMFSTNGKMTKEQCLQFVTAVVGKASKVTENDHNIKKFFEKHDNDNDGILSFDNFLDFYIDAIRNNKEEKIWENLKEFNFRKDLKHITEPYDKEPPVNNRKTLMPRYILSKNSNYFNKIFEIQNDTAIHISDSAYNLVNMLETNELLYNEIISNNSSDYLANAKNNIFQMIYILQIISSILDKIDMEEESKWLKTFISSSGNKKSTKSSLEQIIDIFITQMSGLVDDNKTLIKLYTVELQLIKISLSAIIDSKELNQLLPHYEKVLESDIPIINTEETSIALKSKPNLQLDKIAKIIMENMIILNNKEKNLCFKKDSLKYSFQILIVIVLGYGVRASNELIGLDLNTFLHQQLKIQLPFAQRFGYLTIKILSIHLKEKDEQFFNQCGILIVKEIFNNNKELNEYSPSFVFMVYLHILQTNQYTTKSKIEIIQKVMNELENVSNEFSEDILIGYYSILYHILNTMETLPPMSQNILSILTNKYLINDTEYNYDFSSEKYIKNIFELISLLITKSSTNLMLLYFSKKISELESHISLLPDDKKLYNPSQECKSRIKFIGIKNLSAICYMISIIQQFFIVKPFRYCINKVPSPDNKDNTLYQLQKMFTFLELSNRRDYSPKEFAHSFKDNEGRPIDIRDQCDAQEFLSRFMDKIDESLKPTEFKYLLSGIFGGESCSQLFCKNPDCDKISNRFENLSYLSLEIKQLNTLNESLKKYISEEQIEDFYCEKCKMKVTHSKRVSINKLPNILFIHLQRIAFDYETFQMAKIDSKLEFKRELNLKEYCTERLQLKVIEDEEFNSHVYHREDDYYQYKLIGVLVHTGTAQFGHYFSLINVNDIDKKEQWIKFNDSVVSEYQIDRLQDDTFGRNNSKKGDWAMDTNQNAYILLYERKKKTKLAFVISKDNQDIIKNNSIKEIKDETQLTKALDIFIKPDQDNDIPIKEKPHLYCINKGEKEPKEYLEIIDYDTFIQNESTKEPQMRMFYDEAILDNIKFNNDKKIFTKYFSELIELSAKQIHLNTELSEDNVIKLYMEIHNIIIKIITKSYFKDNLHKIIPEMITTIRAYPKLITILLKEIENSEDKWITSFLLIQDSIMGTSFSSYLSNIIIASISTNTNTDLAYSLLNYYLDYIPVQLSRKWNQMSYFLELFDNLSKSNEPKVMEYLMEKGTIGKLCDFFLGKESPLYNGDNRSEIGNKTIKGKFSPLISAISNLLWFSKDVTPNENEIKCLTLTNFYLKALNEEYNNSAMSKILSYFMIDNKEFTINALNNIIPLINTTTSITNVKNVLWLIKYILSIVDDYTQIRMENMIGIPQLSFDEQKISFSLMSSLITDKETIITKILKNFIDSKDYLSFVDFIYNIIIDNPHVLQYFKNLPHLTSGLNKKGLLKTIQVKCTNLIDALNLRQDNNYIKQIEIIEQLELTITNQFQDNYIMTEDEQVNELITQVMKIEKESVTSVSYDCKDTSLKKTMIILESKFDIIEMDEEDFKIECNTMMQNFINIDSSGYYLTNMMNLLKGNTIKRQLPTLHVDKSYILFRYFILNAANDKDQQIVLEFNPSNNSSLPTSQMNISIPKQSISEIITVKQPIDKETTISVRSLILDQIQEPTKESEIKSQPNQNDDVCAIVCQLCGETNVIDNSNGDLKCKSCQVFLFN